MERILIADDEEDIREITRSILVKEKYEVILAKDGNEALILAKEQKPDLAVFDFLMPGLNGVEVCQAMKKDPETAGIPVIIVTAYPNQKEQGLQAGAVDFMSKEIDTIDLLSRVRSALKVRHINNELQRAIAYIEELEKKIPKP
jgi:two-component system, OmpR family, alkaline phosphatase synthesis response regulator PhoP